MKNLRLRFDYTDNYRFSLMCLNLEGLIHNKYPGKIFFVDADKDCLTRFSGSFLGPSNRVTGWLIDEEKEQIFQKEFVSGHVGEEWKCYKQSIWAYNDGEYSGKWLFAFRCPFMGEVVL